MKKISITNETFLERSTNTYRTARRFYTLYFPEQEHIYIFKNKKVMIAFINDFQKEMDLFILMLNQIVADLFSIYRQNWAIYRGKDIPEKFLSVDKYLETLTVNDESFFDVINNVVKLTNHIYFIVDALKKSAQANKNYVLTRYIAAYKVRIDKLTESLFNFGKSGKWAAYGEKYDTKKLY